MEENITERDTFLAAKYFFSLAPAFRVTTPDGELLLYGRQKLFRLKEIIRVYSDTGRTQEVFRIQAHQIIDFSAAYDVIDSETQEKVGVLRRKGWHSIVRDRWEVLDKDENLFAVLEEDSSFLAFIRRWLLNFIPQTYYLSASSDGAKLGVIAQQFNLFIHKFNIDFSLDKLKLLDRRLGLALVILLFAIEGRQG